MSRLFNNFGYIVIGSVQTGYTFSLLNYYSDLKNIWLFEPIGRTLTSCVLGIIWPISIPLVLYFDNKWYQEQKERGLYYVNPYIKQ